jgi:predicted metal-dependent peptidase
MPLDLTGLIVELQRARQQSRLGWRAVLTRFLFPRTPATRRRTRPRSAASQPLG